MKVTIKYCTPAMLAALTEVKRGQPCPAVHYATLRARGWITKGGTIAAKGIAFLSSRDVS